MQMKRTTAVLASIPVVALALGALPLLAEEAMPATKTFVQMAQSSPDGKIKKQMVMSTIEKRFDMADPNKTGMLDEKQARRFQEFLKQFTKESGA
jgi:hypothetical protein